MEDNVELFEPEEYGIYNTNMFVLYNIRNHNTIAKE